MTREEAIKILKAIRVYECYPKSASEETKEAIDMAIEALSAEAVPHGRLIDADRLKSYIDCGHLRPPTEVCFSELDVCNMIDKAPTASAEAVEGKWETAYLDHEAMGERPSVIYCSRCNHCFAYKTNFCPHCGADMRGEKHE